jgi:hypothetical protein
VWTGWEVKGNEVGCKGSEVRTSGSVTQVSGSVRASGSFGMCDIPSKCANYASGVESLHWDLLHAYVTLIEVAFPLLNSSKPLVNWGQGKTCFQHVPQFPKKIGI